MGGGESLSNYEVEADENEGRYGKLEEIRLVWRHYSGNVFHDEPAFSDKSLFEKGIGAVC